MHCERYLILSGSFEDRLKMSIARANKGLNPKLETTRPIISLLSWQSPNNVCKLN